MDKAYQETEAWLRKAVRNAGFPLPTGFFPGLLSEGTRCGFSRDHLRDVLDEWLSFGYCRVIDPLTDDIEMLPKGEAAFTWAASLVQPAEEPE